MGEIRFQLWVARAKNSTLHECLEMSRLLISPDADTAVIKSELTKIYGKKFEEFDLAEFVDACMRYVLDRGTVSNLSKHALATAVGLPSLKSLGEAYRLVQNQRSKDGKTIKVFDSLVDILKQNPANQSVAKAKVDMRKIEEA